MEGLDTAARDRVFKYVLGRLGSSVSNSVDASPLQPVTIHSAPIIGVPAKVTDIRTLKEEKNPASAVQMATLVAYYLQDVVPLAERKETIGTADIEKYFKQANFRLPAGRNGAVDTLNNAKGAGYLEAVGRGEFKLNPVGYNLIAHGLTGASSKNGKKKASKKRVSSKRR